MKKLLTLSLFMLSASTFAMDASELKESDLHACEAQVENASEDLREQSKESCECLVENTDYEALAEAIESGDTAKEQEIKQQAAQKCDSDVM